MAICGAQNDGKACHRSVGTANSDVTGGEVELERKVSRVIGDMSFIWITIGDEAGPGSQRGFIERNAIALLSNYNKHPIDPPSEGWLGCNSDRERIRKSGLWNQNHVEEAYDPAFLDTVDQLASETIGTA
jgi:hypothetical protein